MKCPACRNSLTGLTVSDVHVNVCKGGCGGIWFDNYELRKFDEPREHAGEALLDVEVDSAIKVSPSERRNCPQCEGMVMMRHFFSAKKHVEVDECPGCGGVWLDEGELRSIRKLFASEEEREKAAKEYFDEVFGEQLQKMRSESEEKLQKARKFANMFRFICPSYYIPGKQDGAAF